ncbi:MAG: hypothetical protein QG623_371 [Patescibacteria group bacterium]|nr:hypothetical protein [Patescibacteria group bacterium]
MDDAGNGYYDDALALLEICRDASNLFEYAELEEKRELIEFVCQNLLFDGKKVKFNLLQPFDDIYAMSSSNVWQEIADAFQTSALAANEDYKLKNLVELFQLSGSLLTSGVVV